MMRRTLAAVTAATMTAGCATYSDKVAPSYNSPVRLIRKIYSASAAAAGGLRRRETNLPAGRPAGHQHRLRRSGPGHEFLLPEGRRDVRAEGLMQYI
jgi:hypothetical protein